jgi:hypothetical protein
VKRLSIPVLTIALFFSLIPPLAGEEKKVSSLSLPDIPSVELKPIGHLSPVINESSGLIKSRLFQNVFWTHNDSGDDARIFAITKTGEMIAPAKKRKYEGIRIDNAVNIDWEDITADSNGNLIIGDTGNNLNTRKDLAIYIVREPDPFKTFSVKADLRIPFFYPEQKGFPPGKKNFDAEALFWARGKLYVLTKHRGDQHTALYRFDSMDPLKSNPLTLVRIFDIRGQVTAADASPDGRRLVVLTYNAIWLFETDGKSDNYFEGKILWLPIRAGQCEGICFDGERLLISNEQQELFEVPIAALVPVKR